MFIAISRVLSILNNLLELQFYNVFYIQLNNTISIDTRFLTPRWGCTLHKLTLRINFFFPFITRYHRIETNYLVFKIVRFLYDQGFERFLRRSVIRLNLIGSRNVTYKGGIYNCKTTLYYNTFNSHTKFQSSTICSKPYCYWYIICSQEPLSMQL